MVVAHVLARSCLIETLVVGHHAALSFCRDELGSVRRLQAVAFSFDDDGFGSVCGIDAFALVVPAARSADESIPAALPADGLVQEIYTFALAADNDEAFAGVGDDAFVLVVLAASSAAGLSDEDEPAADDAEFASVLVAAVASEVQLNHIPLQVAIDDDDKAADIERDASFLAALVTLSVGGFLSENLLSVCLVAIAGLVRDKSCLSPRCSPVTLGHCQTLAFRRCPLPFCTFVVAF